MENNKKIAFAIHAIGEGGAERVTTILCTRFAEKGYEVHLITNHKREWEYPISDLVKRHVIGENVSAIRPIASFQRISRLRSICKHEKFDALVAFMSMNEYSVFATLGLRTKNIISLRNAIEVLYPNKWKRWLTLQFLSTASGAVFQTKDAYDWFPKKFQGRSTIIFNPVWSQFYGIQRQTEPRLLVASGRLASQKNYPMMLDAVSKVLKKHRVRLEIYGNGDEKEWLMAYAQKLGIQREVQFCGQSNDVPVVLSRADIYLLSSDYEGLPNALMEAMAVGVPCVATDCLGGGSRLLLGNNERGILVRKGDSEGFSEAIMLLLDDNGLKDRLASAAKAYSSRFSVDSCFDEWEEYVLSVLQKEK